MSTNSDCQFIEKQPGEWWYKIQKPPYETDEYFEHGPFPSEEAAQRHRERNYANPGEYSVIPYKPPSKRDLMTRRWIRVWDAGPEADEYTRIGTTT